MSQESLDIRPTYFILVITKLWCVKLKLEYNNDNARAQPGGFQREACRILTEFTPYASLVGGILIGLSAVLLLYANGRIAGISGIVSRLFDSNTLPNGHSAWSRGEKGWQLAFVVGLVVAPLFLMFGGVEIDQTFTGSFPLIAVAGVLVGFGSVWGNGCTSGHGVCGLSRLSVRSLAATATFMGVGAVTVFVLRHVIGG